MNCKWAMRRIVGEFGGVTGVQIWAKRGVERWVKVVTFFCKKEVPKNLEARLSDFERTGIYQWR